MHKIYLTVISLLLLTAGNVGNAAVPTAEEACRLRNSASCEINGLRFFIEDDCPKGAKTLRHKGNERCDGLDEKAGTVEKDPVAAVVRQAVSLPEPEGARQEAAGGFFDNPFLVVAVVGVLQGLISRAALGPFFIVAIVMPALVTWGMASGVHVRAEGAEYWAYIGMELLKILGCSVMGWGAGLAIHFGALRLLFR